MSRREELFDPGEPWCNICDKRISDPRCYVMDSGQPFENCICESCMNAELKRLNGKVHWYLNNWVEDQILFELGTVATPKRIY